MKHVGLVCLLVCLLSLVLFVSCGSATEDILAYQREELSLLVAYESGGVPTEARLTLGEGNDTRDVTLAILSPPEAAGLTFCRRGDTLTATLHDTTVPLTDAEEVTALLSFFSVPTSAQVCDITRGENGERTVILASFDTVYTLTFASGSSLPSCIQITTDTTCRTLTVRGRAE